MYDVVFFASNLLLTLLSTQLYQTGSGSITNRDDLFMDFLYIAAEGQLRNAMKLNGDVSHTLPSTLIKALILNIIENITPSKHSLTNVLLKATRKADKYKVKQSISSSSSSLTFQSDLFNFGLFLQNPLKVLARLVTITTGLHIEYNKNQRALPQLSDLASSSSSSSLSTSLQSLKVVSNYRQLSSQPVAEKSLKILLILLNNKRYINNSICNPMREVFCLFHDEQLDNDSSGYDDNELMGNHIDRKIHCDFRALSNYLAKTLPDANSAQLLYSFLQLHPTFTETLTTIDSFDSIITAILKGLYNASNTTVDHLYILIVVTLMFTQDSKLRSKMAKTYIRATWYTERILGDVLLVDLTVLCAIRTAMHALYHLKGDQYLLSNCYAILLNIAPYLIGMHTYTSERLVTIIRRIGTRIIKEVSIESIDKEYQLRCMKETLTVLMRLIGVALRPLRRSSNVHLVYALIHDNSTVRDLFLNPIIISLIEDKKNNNDNNEIDKLGLSFSSSSSSSSSLNSNINSNNDSTPRINSAINISGGTTATKDDCYNIGHYNTNFLLPVEIASLINHYLKTLESRQEQLNTYMTAKKAIQLLRKEIEDEQEAILNIRSNEVSNTEGRLDDDDAMTSMTIFTYEEGDSPEDFFIPFTWTNMIRNSPELSWYLKSITLFDSVAVGLSVRIEGEEEDNNNNV